MTIVYWFLGIFFSLIALVVLAVILDHRKKKPKQQPKGYQSSHYGSTNSYNEPYNDYGTSRNLSEFSSLHSHSHGSSSSDYSSSSSDSYSGGGGDTGGGGSGGDW